MNRLKPIDFKLIKMSLLKQIHRYRIDILIGIGLAIAIAISTSVGTAQIPDPVFTDFYAQDVWFGSDIPTVFGNITSFDSDFGRNNKHPLLPLLMFPLVYGPAKLLHLEPIAAVRLLIVATAVVWIGSLYGLFRIMGCRRPDATLLSILGGVSAASMFWLVVPESFPLGSVTITLGLIFAVLTQYHRFPILWYVGINVLTVSITITNSMVGIFTTLINQTWKRIIQIGIVSLLLSTGLWMAQRIVFTNSGFPFQPGTFIGEKKFISTPEQGSVLAAMSSFFYQTMVMPAVHFLESPIRPDWLKLETNTLEPSSGGDLGLIAVLAWSVLLLLGLWSFLFTKTNIKLRIVLGLTLLAQMAMHSVYGAEETFIYTLHFVPLLLTLVAFSLLSRLRPISLALIAVLIVTAGMTNRTQFKSVTATLWNYGTPQQQVVSQMKQRPSDPWMRHQGQVVLGETGSVVEGKAFHQPGGSFSPQPGSFGVSIWVVDAQGSLKATSDTIPLTDIQQKLIDANTTDIPGIATQTPYYQASWSAVKPGVWQLDLDVTPNADAKPVVVIRSVGPAGGAIASLNWNGQRLLINDRWIVKNLPPGVKVYLGSERSPDWMHSKTIVNQWQDEYGWSYARLELDAAEPWQFQVEDLTPPPLPNFAIEGATEPVLNLPDPQFVDSFNAQIAHLKMGLVGNQTRPGDPVGYPLARFRDGAYQLVALARAGHLELAKQLIPYFATTDFLNGTQPAADIPALGIWTLTTVAEQVNQPDYDQSLWPDLHRKVELILDLLASNRPGYPVAVASETPFSEYPDLVKVDLVAGSMDAMPGLIRLDPTANFMSYRALLDAATFADRVQRSEESERWRSQAIQLQMAWKDTFESRFAGMEATYTHGLWPSWIATANLDAFSKRLVDRQRSTYSQGAQASSPVNPTLTLAEAHQWLYLNQPERVWSAIQQVWEHQASPGLYTWQGYAEANSPDSLSRWHRFRGWMNESYMTPHHLTAAEMLLLQMDMLAYINPSTDTPTLTIGAGIPQDWLKKPFSVEGLSVAGNVINWMWDGKQVNVQIQGKSITVQLGKAFPENAAINVTTLATPDQT